MSTPSCKLCKREPADSDGLCEYCRSLHRLVREFLQVPAGLREWALERARLWSSLLQEEVYKRGEGPKLDPPGVTAKAASLVVAAVATPRSGSVKEEPSPSEDRREEEPKVKPRKEEKSESPVRARSSGRRRRNSSPSRRRRDRPSRRRRGSDSREPLERFRDTRGKERKRRETAPSEEEKNSDRSPTPLRPAEPVTHLLHTGRREEEEAKERVKERKPQDSRSGRTRAGARLSDRLKGAETTSDAPKG